MENEVQIFENNGRGISLPVKEVGGQVYFEAEASAIGLGISRKVNGKDYPRWERVNNYLYPQVGKAKISKGDWITEPQFYKLAFKESNEVAEKFQDWVASDVLPSIRRHGVYMTDAKAKAIVTDKSALADLLQQAADQLKAKDILTASRRWITQTGVGWPTRTGRKEAGERSSLSGKPLNGWRATSLKLIGTSGWQSKGKEETS